MAGRLLLLARAGFGLELQRDAVHAVALPRRLRSVRKHVPEVAAALRAVDFGPRHPVARVGGGFHRLIERCKEAGPSGSALELRVGRKQRLAAVGAAEGAGALFLVEGARAGAFGAVLAQDVMLLRGQSSIGHV